MSGPERIRLGRIRETWDLTDVRASALAALETDLRRQRANSLSVGLIESYLLASEIEHSPAAPRASVAPVVAALVTGMPRSGTTALRTALGKRLGLRSLIYWEAGTRSSVGGRGRSDQAAAVALAERKQSLKRRLSPGLHELYPVGVFDAEEELVLAEATLTEPLLAIKLGLRGYLRSCLESDAQPAVEALEHGLLSLSNEDTPPWILKCPMFAAKASAWCAAFPRTHWVILNRDRDEVWASLSKLLRAIRQTFRLMPTAADLDDLARDALRAIDAGRAVITDAVPHDRVTLVDHSSLRRSFDAEVDRIAERIHLAGQSDLAAR